MSDVLGKVLKGDIEQINKDYSEFNNICFDLNEAAPLDMQNNNSCFECTLNSSVEVEGCGTFNGRKKRHLKLCPTDMQGWWFKRTDVSEPNLIKVSYENASTVNYGGVNNIVLGLKNNSDAVVRLTEHIIALKTFTGVDNLVIETDSFDPPLFDKGSLDIIEAMKTAGRKKTESKLKKYMVKQKVVMGFGERGFLMLEPPEKKDNDKLILDCGINFTDNVMGKQRIKFPVIDMFCEKGSVARTNSSLKHAILCKTIGKLIPSTRNLGYSIKNILVTGKNRYYNKPRLMDNSKSLEPIWHRAVLDLLAAVALIPDGLLVGKLTSYKAGHTQDVEFIKELYRNNLLERTK